MTFKVGDKVRCIDDGGGFGDLTLGKEYKVIKEQGICTYVIDDRGVESSYFTDRFELVQEDKLPHELLGLPKYFVVKKDESDPLWGEFLNWYNDFFGFKWVSEWQYYGYDGNSDQGVNAWDEEIYITKSIKIITLAERDRCVNKKKSQTKQLSKEDKPERSCTFKGSIYKEDSIDGVLIEEMKATRDNINSKLLTHRNLFDNPKK